MKNIIILISSVLLLTTCEETIELDLEQAEEQIVIEGLITNEYKQHTITISKTNPFNGSGTAPAVSGAIVSVENSEGIIYEFKEEQAGKYLSADPFAGVPGMEYSLLVSLGDKEYTATEELRAVASFDSLTYRINPDEQADPEDENRFYEVLMYTKEPQETEDFYLFKFYRNGEAENENGLFVFVSDDIALGGDINAFPAPVYYAAGDVAHIEIYSLTRQAYRYWLDLSSNVNNDGGMFSGQPANVSTNIRGGAIGYFQVSGVEIGEIVIE